jgi:DNA topoisomerase-1
MGKTVVIVESPGKIKKIQSILGANYKVLASVGHIMDLDPRDLSIDIENDFKPIYHISQGKASVVKNLKTECANADNILIATDEDREGEMIGWCLAQVLKLKNPDRILFNSITKKELLDAVKSPTKINYEMVDAAKGRRVLDRIVGWEASKLLIKHVGQGKLSAGRVQSVVTRMIMDRDTEVEEFLEGDSSSFFKIKGEFGQYKAQMYTKRDGDTYEDQEDPASEDSTGTKLKTKDDGKDHGYKGDITKLKGKKEARKLMKLITKSEFPVAHVFVRKSKKNPSPPFETSTLQQAASSKLGFTSKRTMTSAQRLYEQGLITYMRTDSVSLSKEAMSKIKEYVLKEYGEDWYKYTPYKTKAKNSQEAHEAIRPTDVTRPTAQEGGKIGSDEVRLYSLIWKRAVASQMAPAEYDIHTIQIDVTKAPKRFFQTEIEQLTFEGYLILYGEEVSEEVIKLPKVGKKLKVKSVVATEEYQQPPLRYTEASLINKMKKLSIGRPSTYASIISKIEDRGYVEKKNIDGVKMESLSITWDPNKEKEELTEKIKECHVGRENKKYTTTSLGRRVTAFMVQNFDQIMDYKFTAMMEEDLDKIAHGKKKWVSVISKFYDTFHPQVVELTKKAPMDDNKFSRQLGQDEDGYQIIATEAKYGPVVKREVSSRDVDFASIPKPKTIKTITLQEAIDLLPKRLGVYNKKQIVLKKGENNYYIKYGTKFVSLQDKPVDLKEAIKAIEEKDEKDKNKTQFKNDDFTYTVMDGKFGPYLIVKPNKKGGKSFNVSVPKHIAIAELDIARCELIRKSRYRGKGKGTNTKTKGTGNPKAKKKD